MNITDRGSPSRFLNRCKTDPLMTFQMIEKIGKGNCSDVYKALNKITDQLVTIKIFPLSSISPSEDDISFLKNLDHPFIDRILDIYTLDQQIWLVSDYYQLGSIYDIITMTKQPLSEPEISCVCYSVLYALDYIHALNKVHRGIKTSNILINALGQVKLTDFESAMWEDLGTKEGKDCEYSGDIWGLGHCALEMTGEIDLMDRQGSQNQPIIRNKLSKELNDFISQCLQADPKRRPRPSGLFDHPFICKYKAELPHIRKKLINERMEKITEYKKSAIKSQRSHRSQPQKGVYHASMGEENVADESELPSNTVDETAQKMNNNTIEYALENDNCVSFIDKPSFHFTDIPSHIELTNRNHLYHHFQEPISHIQHVRDDDSQDFEITPRMDQLSIISGSDKVEFTTEKKDSRVPPLKLGTTVPVHRGRMPTIDSRFSSENTQTKSKGNRDEGLKPPTSGDYKNGLGRTSASRPKMYKATNESNFVVKHKISTTAMDHPLNYSADTETTLNPITVDRQKLALMADSSGASSTIPMVDGLDNYAINIPRVSNKELKELTVSTAMNSKGSSSFKSVFHTPNPSDSRKSVVLKVIKENLEQGSVNMMESPTKRKENGDVEAERRRLEKQMERELAEIKKKYGSMINGLGKVNE